MRIREILVASLLTLTFGCPGDDSGDTEANTTPGSTSDTPGTTTDTPSTTTDTPSDTTTDTPSDTTTDDPGTSSSGGDSSGGMGSSSGGMVDEACEGFCNGYFDVCGDSPDNDYGDVAGCVQACAEYDQATFECKEYHASMADGPQSVHCAHANRDGGGVC